MNLWFTLRAPFYLPYRMQLVNKYIIIGIGFSSALPALYPVLFLFFELTCYRHSAAPLLRLPSFPLQVLFLFLASWFVDKWNLLRLYGSRGVPVTTEKMVESCSCFPMGGHAAAPPPFLPTPRLSACYMASRWACTPSAAS